MLLAAAVGIVTGNPPSDVSTIVQRSVTATKADWQAASGLDYRERDRDPTARRPGM